MLLSCQHQSVEPLTDDELRLWHAWKRASERVRARVAETIAAETGLSDPDFAILTRVEDAADGALRQNELAASLGWHRSRLSHQLTRMQERGLVTRVAAGTGVEVRATSAGREVIARARPHHAAAVREHLIAHATPEFLVTLERLAR